MKGKKRNTEFINNFINECLKNNKLSTSDILKEAKDKLFLTDEKIKEIFNLKKMRSDLLDVIECFENKENKISLFEKDFSFFTLKDHNICIKICNLIKKQNISINSISLKEKKEDIIFYIKQMLELKILYKIDNCLTKGENFEDYMKFLNKHE